MSRGGGGTARQHAQSPRGCPSPLPACAPSATPAHGADQAWLPSGTPSRPGAAVLARPGALPWHLAPCGPPHSPCQAQPLSLPRPLGRCLPAAPGRHRKRLWKTNEPMPGLACQAQVAAQGRRPGASHTAGGWSCTCHGRWPRGPRRGHPAPPLRRPSPHPSLPWQLL